MYWLSGFCSPLHAFGSGTVGGKIENWTLIRKIMSNIATFIAHFVIPKNVTDPMSGYFGMNSKSYLNIEEKIPGCLNTVFHKIQQLEQKIRKTCFKIF